MRFLEFFRNRAYWIIDFFKGSKVKKFYNNIVEFNDGSMSESEKSNRQKAYITQLLNHSISTVPYYKEIKSRQLENWPVVNKDLIKQNKTDFISIAFNNSELIKMSTSGSTGTPFVSLQNIGKKQHVNAETMFYMGLLGYKVGCRIIFLRSLVNECEKSKTQQFAQNIYQINCNDLSDEGIEKKIREIQQLSHATGAYLIGYASTYDSFRKYFEENGYEKANECKIKAVVSGSEMLYDVTRDAMEKAFKCKCVSRYANEENGFLGQDMYENNVFIINRADYFIEILQFDSDIPVTNSKEVGRIVVTDLFNYALPMIRYDTGDVGAIENKIIDGKEYQVITSFGGRAVDTIYDSKGNQLSPHSITNAMWSFQQLRQFKFIQVGPKNYEIQLNVGDEQINEDDLISELSCVLGSDSYINVLYVDEIPVLASGKRKYIENRWIN